MVETKLLEVRDAATFIPVIASRMRSLPEPVDAINEAERYLLMRSGFGSRNDNASTAVMLTPLCGRVLACCDPYDWPNTRTLGNAHQYIEEHWDQLESGDVVDVEYNLGEAPRKKLSERFQS